MSRNSDAVEPVSPPSLRALMGLESRVLRDHPALFVTLGYFCVSLIGMMFSWSLLRDFGLDIFEYAEITDFLMAALREPMTFLVAGGGVLTAWGLCWWSTLEQRFFERKPPKSKFSKMYRDLSRWGATSPSLILVIITLYAYLFISIYADYRADVLRAGGGERVLVATQAEPQAQPRTLLGTTSRFLLLLDLEAQRVEVVPLEAVIEVETESPLPDEEEAAPAEDSQAASQR